MEEYARLMQLFDDIVSMKNAMLRLEVYMVIMVCQIACGVFVSFSLSLLTLSLSLSLSLLSLALSLLLSLSLPALSLSLSLFLSP